MPTNRELAQTDEAFRAACATAGVEPNRIQYRKWKSRRGIAFLTANHTTRELQRTGLLDKTPTQPIASGK